MPESRCTIPKTAKTDLEFNCLQGNVHTVKSENAIFVKKDGKYVKAAVSQAKQLTYDNKGNLLEQLSHGTKDYGTEFSISRVVFNFKTNGVATGWVEYGQKGKEIRVRNIYSYDKIGNRTKQIVTYLQSGERSILILTYDSMGNKIKERGYYPVPSNVEIENISEFNSKYFHTLIKYKYHNNSLIETTHYDKENLVRNKIINKYENGNKKEVVSYSLNKNNELVRFGRITYTYDQKGNVIKKTVYKADDSIKTRHIKGYDNRGFVTSHRIYTSNGKLKMKRDLKYNYDSQGNWLSYTFSKKPSNKSFQVELRTITYY